MFLTLHNLTIQLKSDTAVINQQWRQLFAGWPLGNTAPTKPDMKLSLSLVDVLPPLPGTPPFFNDDIGVLSVYPGEGNEVYLHYPDGALVNVPLYTQPPAAAPTADGYLTQQAVNYGRFEDITFTSLAPLLRRQGYFLVHAFAAAKDGRAALIVGPSGSGKTTTGLSLLLAGWSLLSNDTLLLQERPDGIYALTTPGSISIRPKTVTLLPRLRGIVNKLAPQGQTDITQALLAITQWSEAAKVTAVYFPQIEQRQQSALSSQNRAICLAQLMSESVDQWDAAMLLPHMTLLQTLSQQATPYTLHLGPDATSLPQLLEQSL